MTKGQRKAYGRRQIRRKERGSLVAQDVMAGRVLRRSYGRGAAKK